MSIGDWDEGTLARFIESVLDRGALGAALRQSQPICIVNHSLIALTSGVAASVPFDTEVWDPLGMHAVNATGVVVPSAGRYFVAAQSQLQAGSPGGAFTWALSVVLTSAIAQVAPGEVVLGNGAVGFNYTDGCTGIVSLAAGDSLSLVLSQNTGIARNAVSSFLAVARLG